MKSIYIDGLGLVDPHFSGVGQYILGTLKGLDNVLEDMRYAGQVIPKVKIIVPNDGVNKIKKLRFKHIGYKKFPVSYKRMNQLWYGSRLPFIDLFCGRGIYVFPRFVDMPLLFSRSIIVVHDLSYEFHKEFSDENNANFLAKNVPKSIKSSVKVIAVSKTTKKDVVRTYHIPEEKVTVIYNATDPNTLYRRSAIEIEKVKKKYGIKGDYILSLANLEPRKNLDILVNAYCQLPKSITNNLSLLLVGVTGWKTDELFLKILDKVEQGFNIIRPSKYVTDLDKAAIISGAKMLVYPSHYEGFGMPPLEALACGVPVICADNSSLPEVVGRAAKLVPSNDLNGLVKAIQDYLDDYQNVASKALVEGPKQASKFSWKESARVLFDTISDIS